VTDLRLPDRLYRGYIFDLDGTVYLGDRALPGAADTIAWLRAGGASVVFLTNKPLELPASYAAKLTALGIPATAGEIVSSTDALLAWLAANAAGATLFPVSEPLVADLLRDAGFRLSDDPAQIDLVVVSFDRTFDYAKLRTAYLAVRAGARIVATNPDPFCPTPDGGLPDCAAMLAAIEVASGAKAEAIVGKPSLHMTAAVLARLDLDPADCVLVGDRLHTDMLMANAAGIAGALVLTGATAAGDLDASPVRPDFVLETLRDLIPAAGSVPGAAPHVSPP
jgi:NagD protein